MPVSVAGGIYDFSGTQASHCYAESNITCSKDEVSSWTKSWWDGSSDGWLADGDFNALMKDYKVTIDGKPYMAVKSKTSGSKMGAVIGHSDFTCVVAVFDEDKGTVAGSCAMAVSSLMEAYKEAGY